MPALWVSDKASVSLGTLSPEEEVETLEQS